MKLLTLTLAALTLAACSQNIQTKEAVREAVVEYLKTKAASTGLDMSKMNVEVLNMKFEADTAKVTVAFNLKTGEGGMEMPYDLERKGNKWVVKPAAPAAGANPHQPDGAVSAGDKGKAPLPSIPQLDGPLPAGHPPVGSNGK